MLDSALAHPDTAPTAEVDVPISTRHKLIVGDARSVTPKEVGPVELVVTSPPYWNLKDYGPAGQIGFNQGLSEYVSSLQKVWRLCYRSLRPGCRMVINVGDQYLRASKGNPYHVVPLHAITVNSVQSLKGCDFLYLGSIVWRKISTTHTSGGGSVMGSYPYPRAVYPCFENEYLAIFRKAGDAPRPDSRARDLSRMDIDEWRDLTQGVWTVPPARMDENPAAFPEAIPSRFIRMFTFPGETVMDPFVGSGTTMRVAAALGRDSVGIELGFSTASGRPFEEVIRDRITSAEQSVSYAGKPIFLRARATSLPAVPHPSHS